MNRYFLYLVLLNMLINVIIFVPKILIEYRYEGAVMGVLIAIPLGFSLNVVFSKMISKFPEKGFPEIFSIAGKKRWFIILPFGIISLITFSSGLISLLGFVDILRRFVNPEMPYVYLLSIFLTGVLLIIQLPTDRVMYLLEIVLFLNTPLITFIIFKAFTSEFLVWDSILEVGTYLFAKPSLKAIAAASYAFSGYTNLIIFNRIIKGKLKMWNFLVILVLGLINLFTTFFIPIGFHGSDGAQEYLYPWISTADSLRLVYSPIERVIFLFLIFYMGITLMSVSVHWHVAFELIKGTYKESRKKNWAVLVIFTCCTIICAIFLNTILLNKITVHWMIVRLGLEIMIVGLFFIWARRKTA
ncbi:spore germination protein [Neobacillus mesonae]|uniref:spore germination protein n=1 Tax=Neobacillus mesonae TaxID=1193713 RepID=UPI0020410564|nr:spore germination protein [Neobacillus mesonae]MCM3566911.1 spore germination protein [Neobacillus mesonae]